VFVSAVGPTCFSAQAVAEEVAEHVPVLAARRKLDASLLLAALSVMPINWQPAEVYEPHRDEAERRMAGRDPEDWPTVALALALSLPVWSQDKDIAAGGVTVFTTGYLLDAIRSASGEEI